MDTFLRYLQSKAFGRGFSGKHTAWLVVGAGLWMVLRARNQDDVIFRTELKPGERLFVTTSSPPSTSSPTSSGL